MQLSRYKKRNFRRMQIDRFACYDCTTDAQVRRREPLNVDLFFGAVTNVKLTTQPRRM